MKRLWIGVILLAVLLAGALLQSLGLAAVHEDLSETLEKASVAARRRDWGTAYALDAQARQQWGRCRHITAAFADHEPLEELEALLEELQICKELSLEENYAVVCSQLSQICKAISESFAIAWWNVL